MKLALPAAGLLVAMLGVTGVSLAGESPPATTAAKTATPSLLPDGRSYTVTLLTGDVVSVRGTAEGCPAVSVRPAGKSGVLSRSCGPDGHVRVIPAQVVPLLDKTLDPALFDVTALILDGYDDAHTKDLPLIVQQPLAKTPFTAGLAKAKALPSIGAVSGRQSKKSGAQLVRSLMSPTATKSKVWLDRRVSATFAPERQWDANLRQIAAPQAWDAGFTGTGERVAVLDTGIDATHPDLDGQIAEKMDFTVDGGDAADHFGHGTHVASLIAGTGAASHGERRGVAPSAKLVIGKVLDDNGEGTDSQVIAGMEWAAARATVVNMSLGGWEPSDGSDPLSLALDSLTKQTGALFVVAAGNDGPVNGTVSSPGAAAGALTVGAVDSHDVLAAFSSRGPLVGTRAAKPEIVAPGVDIVAARAAGTTMGEAIDARYVAASGTSMATPQVAGAAAVLAQRHPDWKAAQLKAALVGAADPTADGERRLDVSRPLDGIVSGQPVVNLGTFPYPQTGTAETKLTWTNTGQTEATVTLGATEADAITLSATRLTLAAGASGGVTVSIDRAAYAAHPGLYTATVTASVGGKPASRTPLAFYAEPPSHDLTLETTPIPGTPDDAYGYVGVQVVNLDDPAVFADGVYGDPGDTMTVRVPEGRYSVMGSSMTWADNDSRAAMAGDPDLAVTADTTVRLDLAAAKPLTGSVDGVTTTAGSVGVTFLQTARRGPTWGDFAFAWGADAQNQHVFIAPNDGAGIGSFRAYGAFGLSAPGSLYDLIREYSNGIPADPSYRVTAAEKAKLARIDQRFNQLDSPGSITGHKRYGLSPDGEFIAENTTAEVSGDRTDYVTPGVTWLDEAFWDGTVTQEGAATYAPGSHQSKVWIRQPLRSDWYDNATGSPSGCAPAAPARTSGNMHLEMVTLTDQHGRFDCLADGFGLDLPRTLTLERDGRTVGTSELGIADFTVPRAPAGYRLTYDVDTSAVLPVSTHLTTSWTFRSAGPNGTGKVPLPLLAVDYSLPLDQANHPTASGEATFKIQQPYGVKHQSITSFTVSVSLDGGVTWQAAPAVRTGDGAYRARLPQPAAGQTVSLRVTAKGSAGSGIDQRIIDAYK